MLAALLIIPILAFLGYILYYIALFLGKTFFVVYTDFSNIINIDATSSLIIYFILLIILGIFVKRFLLASSFSYSKAYLFFAISMIISFFMVHFLINTNFNIADPFGLAQMIVDSVFNNMIPAKSSGMIILYSKELILGVYILTIITAPIFVYVGKRYYYRYLEQEKNQGLFNVLS